MIDLRRLYRLALLRKLTRCLAQVCETKRMDEEVGKKAERVRRQKRESAARMRAMGKWKKPGETPREYLRRLGREAMGDTE